MRVQLIEIIKRANGAESRREKPIEAASARIGRSTNCEIYLPDPRVLLHQASIEMRPSGPTLVSEAETGVTVNGAFTNVRTLAPGDEIDLGPYRMTVVPAPANHDLALTLALTQPPADDYADLTARSGTSLARIGLGKRGWSYVLFVAVFAIFVALPLAGRFFKPEMGPTRSMMSMASSFPANADRVWISGEVSNAHKFFGNTCEACHRTPFVQVTDAACLSCHGNIREHADPAMAPMGALAGLGCQTCHKEHTGPQAVVLRADSFCTGCHADLSKKMPDTKLLDAVDFDRRHPQFRPTIPDVTRDDPWHRVALGSTPPPEEKPGLKFPHDKHLVAGGLRHPEHGKIPMTCASCHRPDSGGVGLLPVSFARDCHGCHKLRFDPAQPDREMPHGSAAAAKLAVQDFYAAAALRGGAKEADAPAVARRRPGQMLTEPERLEALAWASAKAAGVLGGKFGEGLCGECHLLKKADDGLFDIVQPHVADRFLPKGRFPHDQHREVACADCHKAPTSQSAGDVLLPGIETCRSCHGSTVGSEKVESACISCHVFHRPGMALMRKADGSTTGNERKALAMFHKTAN